MDRAGDRQPDLLVYFTDAKGEFPDCEPSFPVIWLVKGKADIAVIGPAIAKAVAGSVIRCCRRCSESASASVAGP